eukprot:TRINITY_DN6920_c0_g1_i1.p1 TRINITY_DN6920_c0_g1~~TRINITY_DN6920_c0_g1_i1.p1  ORF type:complete len:152 (-),score=2.92 TRINITY_DN6920_c0_g1_i1:44-499(-)
MFNLSRREILLFLNLVDAYVSHKEEIPEDDENRVSTSQFEKLASSSSIRLALRNPELQNIIREIDASPNRLRSLENHLGHNEDFLRFVHELLLTIGVRNPTTSSLTPTDIQSTSSMSIYGGQTSLSVDQIESQSTMQILERVLMRAISESQ